jgi:uncharacterized protein (DUF305 family)
MRAPVPVQQRHAPVRHERGGAGTHHQAQQVRAARQAEIRFMKDMIDHHHMAVMMGDMAVEKAVHTELAELGADIVETQTTEIEQMRSWLRDWYGIEYEPQMSRHDEREMSELEGEEFEIEFLQGMIRHHAMAVMMSRSILRHAGHDELKDLARQIIETQTAEIQQMQDWLSEWYAIDHHGMGGGGHGGMGDGGGTRRTINQLPLVEA